MTSYTPLPNGIIDRGSVLQISDLDNSSLTYAEAEKHLKNKNSKFTYLNPLWSNGSMLGDFCASATLVPSATLVSTLVGGAGGFLAALVANVGYAIAHPSTPMQAPMSKEDREWAEENLSYTQFTESGAYYLGFSALALSSTFVTGAALLKYGVYKVGNRNRVIQVLQRKMSSNQCEDEPVWSGEVNEIFQLCDLSILSEMGYDQLKVIYENNPEKFLQYMDQNLLSDPQTVVWERIVKLKNRDKCEILRALNCQFFKEDLKKHPILLVGVLQFIKKELVHDSEIMKNLVTLARENFPIEIKNDAQAQHMLLLIAEGNSNLFVDDESFEVVVDAVSSELDVTFQIDDQEIKGNRNNLSRVSEVFNAMLTGGMLEKDAEYIRIRETTPDSFQEMIHFSEGKDVEVNKENLEDLLNLSRKYLLGGLKKVCEKYMILHTDRFKREYLLDLSKKYSLGQLLVNLIDQLKIEIKEYDPLSFEFEKICELVINYKITDCETIIQKKVKIKFEECRHLIDTASLENIVQLVDRIEKMVSILDASERDTCLKNTEEFICSKIGQNANFLKELWEVAVQNKHSRLKSVVAAYCRKEENWPTVRNAWLALPEELGKLIEGTAITD